MTTRYMYVFSTTGSTWSVVWSVVVAPCVSVAVAFDLTSRYDTDVRIRTVRLRMRLQTTIGYIGGNM